MATGKREFDSSLGGSVVLPTNVSTYRYAASAVQEMRELLADIRNPSSTKLVFQRLPKHMRRRAMSHHPKRLPRKHRAAHQSQMAKSGQPSSSKVPSRKHRRRPGNLIRDYLRRQRRNIWLETHIWHARRFHMVERWGYRLPYASCDKTYRACYRATAEHCLIQDISFHACLQLYGPVEMLRVGFTRLSSAQCGLSIVARTYLGGRREGKIDLFRDGQYPEGVLTRASFMWRPLDEDVVAGEDTKRTLWLWVHPSAYHAVLEELITVFELVSTKSEKLPLEEVDAATTAGAADEVTTAETATAADSKKEADAKKPRVKEQRRLQFMTRTLAFERIKSYMNSEQSMLLCELKDTMNRFRLTGPLTQAVLANAFKAKELNDEPETSTSTSTATSNWFQRRLTESTQHRGQHEAQAAFWREAAKLGSPAELNSNMILALNITDPRANRPVKRSKAARQQQPSTPPSYDFLVASSTPCLSQGAIWDVAVRDRCGAEMLSTHNYDTQRAKHAIVPGAPCRFEADLQPVPVLLVQRPGSQLPGQKRLGYGCGWDVIAPAGYGMAIWLALVMWGARPGGLRECASIARELGTEEHLPDTVTGRQQAAERHAELRARFFRLPPNKRCNYRKFSVISPFRAPFAELVRDWRAAAATPEAMETGSYFVLRDRELLQQLQAYCTSPTSAFPADLPERCLIQLQLRMKTRGNAGDLALICLPTRADFKRNLRQQRKEQNDAVFTEPLLPDPGERERKQLRTEHKKLLLRMRRRRVREKRKKMENCTQRVRIRPAGTEQLVAAQFQRMAALWLPEDCGTLYTVRRQCGREVCGYATHCGFSFTEATVCAVGYVTPAGLEQLLLLCRQLHMRQPMLLVRSNDSRHYRFASFKINVEI